MYKKCFILSVFLILSMSLSAQSNDTIDTFLDRSEADLATTVWLVLLAEDLIPENADIGTAISVFRDSGFSSKISTEDPGRPVEFGEFAYIAMEAMDLPGGMMYAIFPTPRYASREFLFRRWIPGRPKQKAILTPWEVTTSISELMAWKEAQK